MSNEGDTMCGDDVKKERKRRRVDDLFEQQNGGNPLYLYSRYYHTEHIRGRSREPI
jgi:hypothetical protein